MAKESYEIERKFLVTSDGFRKDISSSAHIVQGYLMSDKERSLRARIYGDKAFITFKSKAEGIARYEWEHEIPVEEARELLEHALDRKIDKTRHIVIYDGRRWEIDEFHSPRKGLILAEIELEDENEEIRLPEWAGKEVTSDPAYLNCNIASAPEER